MRKSCSIPRIAREQIVFFKKGARKTGMYDIISTSQLVITPAREVRARRAQDGFFGTAERESWMDRKKAPCTAALIAANAAVFILLSFGGMTEDAYYMLQHGAMYLPLLQQGEYYRLLTCLFLHFGFSHLVNNMIMLGVMGWQLELVVGKIRFLLIYFASGIGGNLLSALADLRTGDFAVSAGASGAIFGIIGALLYIAVRNHGRIGNISGQGLLLMIALTLYYGFTSSGVDNFAHIGGLAAGFALAALLYRKTDAKFRPGMDR